MHKNGDGKKSVMGNFALPLFQRDAFARVFNFSRKFKYYKIKRFLFLKIFGWCKQSLNC